eukprot:3802195-Prymnesium_polylepis.1
MTVPSARIGVMTPAKSAAEPCQPSCVKKSEKAPTRGCGRSHFAAKRVPISKRGRLPASKGEHPRLPSGFIIW